MKLTLTLERREMVAERTMAFHFRRPSDFTFAAGQALDWTLIDPPETDSEGNVRTFTIASAPSDPDIMFATRLRDTAFKRVVQKLPLGTDLQAEGPDGSFTLHADATRPAVFLTGGIGITPFRSIIRDAIVRKLAHQLWLFYSKNRPEDAAFLGGFEQLAKTTPTLHFVPTMTDMAKSKQAWRGATGVIGRDDRPACRSGPICYVASAGDGEAMGTCGGADIG